MLPVRPLTFRATLRRMTNYTIDITSDTVCPWCYVGKRRLDAAIEQHRAQHPEDSFTLTWHPFQLAPDATRTVDKQKYYEQKFGAQRTQMMQAHLAKVGQQLGIDFAFGGKVGNTRDSHRLVQLGKTKGNDTALKVMQQIFTAYFEKNDDITDHDVLVGCASRAGLGEQEAREWLQSGKGGPEIDREVHAARANHISGVPNFQINGEYIIRGAEEPASFLQVFEEIKGTSNGESRKVEGPTC